MKLSLLKNDSPGQKTEQIQKVVYASVSHQQVYKNRDTLDLFCWMLVRGKSVRDIRPDLYDDYIPLWSV